MGSKKRSNWSKQKAAFNDSLYGFDNHQARSQAHQRSFEAERRRHEATRKRKSCTSKKRYDSEFLAEAAIDSCREYGNGGLTAYHCDFCDGWHLTSHAYGD